MRAKELFLMACVFIIQVTNVNANFLTEYSKEVNLAQKNLIEYELSNEDANLLSDTGDVSFPIADSIFVDAGEDQFLTMPVDSIFLSASVQDPYNQVVSAEWVQVMGDSSAQLSGIDPYSTMVFNVIEGYYEFEYRAINTQGTIFSDLVAVYIKSESNDTVPSDFISVEASTYYEYTLPIDSVHLSGYINDPYNEVVQKEWIQIAGDTLVTIQTYSNDAIIFNVKEGYYGFEFRVMDVRGFIYSDDVWFTVLSEPIDTTPTDTIPSEIIIVDAGQDQFLTMPVDSIFLSALVDDPAEIIVSREWVQIAGDSSAYIYQWDNNAVVFGVFEGDYSFEFRATDTSGFVYSDIVWVNIQPEIVDTIPTDTVFVYAGEDQFLTMPVDSIFLSALVDDPANIIVSREWVQIAGDSSAMMSGFDLNSTMVFNVFEGVYGFEFIATDLYGFSYSDIVWVDIQPEIVDTIPIDTVVIIDNNDSYFSFNGNWVRSTAGGVYKYDFDYFHDGNTDKGLSSASMVYPIRQTNTYEVFAWWFAYRNRSTNTPFIINHANGSDTILVNQKRHNAQWVSLGTYEFSDQVNINIENYNTTGYVIVDAIKLQLSNETVNDTLNNSDEIIIDNDDIEVSLIGDWTVSTAGKDSKYLYNYYHDGNTNKGQSKVIYSTVLQSGEYEVFGWWFAYNNRATNTMFEIKHANGTTYKTMNQQQNNAQWVSLGRFTFDYKGIISISNYQTNGYVVADAIKFKKINSINSLTEQEDIDIFKTTDSKIEMKTPEDISVVISPNPSNGCFVISFDNYAETELEIFDILSRKSVYRGKYFKNSILDLNLTTGVYIIHTTFDKKTYINKLIIQ